MKVSGRTLFGVVGAILLLQVCAGCGSTDPVGGGQGRHASYAATRSYLLATEARLRTSWAHAGAGYRAMRQVAERARASCAVGLRRALRQLNGARRRETDKEFNGRIGRGSLRVLEALREALEMAQEDAYARPIGRFAASVLQLRWGDQRVNALVHAFALTELRRLKLPPPEVCGAVRRWAASGYQHAPIPAHPMLHGPVWHAWLRASSALGRGGSFVPTEVNVLRALKRYAPARSRALTRTIEVMQTRFEQAQRRALASAIKGIAEGLGVPVRHPPSSSRPPVTKSR